MQAVYKSYWENATEDDEGSQWSYVMRYHAYK